MGGRIRAALRQCPKCKEVLAGGEQTYCRPCWAARSRQWRSENPEKSRESVRQNKLLLVEGGMTRGKAYDLAAYGLTPVQLNLMLAAQGNSCALCRESFRHGKRVAYNVDHDHATGRVRGLLCNTCNTGIGKFKDDPERLIAAAAYLRGE